MTAYFTGLVNDYANQDIKGKNKTRKRSAARVHALQDFLLGGDGKQGFRDLSELQKKDARA